MHSYSINTEERKYILICLAFVSIFLSWICHRLLVNRQISLAWWVESPSVLFFYGLLFVTFDRWFWRYFKKIRLVKTLDLAGKWTGILKTSFDDQTSELKVSLKIVQTWTSIKILLTTDQSLSVSETASVVIDVRGDSYLTYQFINEPKSSSATTMSIHRGTAKLVFDEKKKSLDGEYYSGRGRQNFGSIRVVKECVVQLH